MNIFVTSLWMKNEQVFSDKQNMKQILTNVFEIILQKIFFFAPES